MALKQLRRLLSNLSEKTTCAQGSCSSLTPTKVRAPRCCSSSPLARRGSSVRAHDTVPLNAARERYRALQPFNKAGAPLNGAHPPMLATEWDECKTIRPEEPIQLLEEPILIDARGVWNVAALRAARLHLARTGGPQTSMPEPNRLY